MLNPNQIRLATRVIYVAAITNDLVVNWKNHKRNKRNAEMFETLNEENEQLRAALNASANQASYLLKVLDQNEIPVSEFDLIVLNNPDLV